MKVVMRSGWALLLGAGIVAVSSPAARADPPQIAVRVVDENGVPIDGAQVSARRIGEVEYPPAGRTEGGQRIVTGKGGEPLEPGAYRLEIRYGGESQVRNVYVDPKGDPSKSTLLTVRFLRDPKEWTQWPHTDQTVSVGLGAWERARTAAQEGDAVALAAARSVLTFQRDEAAARAREASEVIEQYESELLNDPALPHAAGLREKLEGVETPMEKAWIIDGHVRRIRKDMRDAGPFANQGLRRIQDQLLGLATLYRNLAAAQRDQRTLDGYLQETQEARPAKKPDEKVGSLTPALPGQFFASFSPRANVVDLPDFEYVTLADFQNQVVFVPELLRFDNDGAGYDLGWQAGYVLPEPCWGEQTWLQGELRYGQFEARNTKSSVSTGNADAEFFSPRGGGGFTLLNPGQLTDVRYDLDYEHFAASASLYQDWGPCACDLRLTTFGGLAWETLEFDQRLRLDAGNFSVERRDTIDRHAGGVRAGAYLSQPLGPFTVYGGGYGGILYAGADGDARLVGRLNGNVFADDRKSIEEHGFVFEAGGAVGLRFDLDYDLPYGARPSLGLEAAFDWTDGALEIDYPNSPRGNADLNFRSAWSSRVGAQITLSF